MNYLAKAGTEALAGSILGNRIIRYAFDTKPNLIKFNKNDAIAIGAGTLTPVIMSHIFKASLRSITGFHGISGCVIAGILTYLLHKKEKNTMLHNTQTYHSKNSSNDKTCRISQIINKTLGKVKKIPINTNKTMTVADIPTYCLDNEQYKGLEKHRTSQKEINKEIIDYTIKKQHKENLEKVTKKNIANQAVTQLEKMQDKSNQLTQKYTQEIDAHIPLIKETIDKLLEDCSPENIIPLTRKTVHILSKLKEKKGSELQYAYTEMSNHALKPLYELQDSLQELHEIIKKSNVTGREREKIKNYSDEMIKKIQKIRVISKKSLFIADNSKNELTPIAQEISRLVTEHAEQIYATGLLKNVNYIVSDIASSKLLDTPRFENLKTIMTELSVPELEKFREFAYNTQQLKETIGLDIRGKSLNLNELEEKINKRLSDAVIDTLNQSTTPREEAEKQLYRLLRDVKLHDVEHWRASRKRIEAKKDNFKKVRETFYMADETLNLEELKTLYPQQIDTSKAEAELDELKCVINNSSDVPDDDQKTKALKERFEKLNSL
jgi:hypothetical protein